MSRLRAFLSPHMARLYEKFIRVSTNHFPPWRVALLRAAENYFPSCNRLILWPRKAKSSFARCQFPHVARESNYSLEKRQARAGVSVNISAIHPTTPQQINYRTLGFLTFFSCPPLPSWKLINDFAFSSLLLLLKQSKAPPKGFPASHFAFIQKNN